MNIDEIMKPYFDKKEEFSKRKEDFEAGFDIFINKYQEEIEKYKLENETYENEMLALKTRLQTLRNNRNSEIEEYVKNAVSERPDFYAGYGAMIRKDLEQEYLKREKALELEIIGLSDKINNNYLKIAKNNKSIRGSEEAKKAGETNKFHKVDIREIVDIKHDVRKALIALKKELELKLKETELRFDTVMYKLSTFKYEYDENNNVLNGNEYRNLFEESNALIEVKYNLQRDLKKVDEHLNLTELTEEEIKTIMMSMTDLEKEEYNRRKKVDSIISTVEKVTSEEKIGQIETTNESTNEEMLSDKKIPEQPEKDSVIYETARKGIEEQQRLEQNFSEFMKEVAVDVLDSAKKLRSINLENGKYLSTTNPAREKDGKPETEEYKILETPEEEVAELPNGVYFNLRDVEKALNNYGRQNKGRTFTVKGMNLPLTVTRKTIRKVKKILKKCSANKLLLEKKISTFDIKKVYGKEKAEEYITVDSKTHMPSGQYVLLADVYDSFKELFVEKTPTWKERFVSRFIKNKDIELENVQDAEYEVVKSKTK